MAITFNEIAELVARFGNSVVTEQANLAAPFVGKGVIQKQSHTGTVGIVNVKTGGMMSTGFLADGQKLPDGANVQPQQLAYHPKALFSRLSIPRIAALTAISKQDGVNLVKEQMESVGADLGRTLGRAVFQSISGGIFPAGPVAITATSPAQGVDNTVASLAGIDTSAYRIGATFIGPVDSDPLGTGEPTPLALVVIGVDTVANAVLFRAHVYDQDSGTVGAVYPYDDTTPFGGAPATIGTLDGAFQPSVKILDGSKVFVNIPAPGPGVIPIATNPAELGNTITSLLDLASVNVAQGTVGAPGNYSGVSGATTPDYHGSEVSAAGAGGALRLEDLDDLSKKIKRRSGAPWTHSVCNSTNMHRYMNLLVSDRRFVGGNQAADASINSMATFEGKPVIVDENMPDTDWLLFTQSDTKLAQWRDFQPDYDGSKAAMVSDSSFIYDTQIFGMYNLRCTKRSGLGKITNLTATTW